MATYDTPNTRYSDTILNKRVIGDRVHIIDPMDTPFLSWDGLNSAASKFKINLKDYALEWIEDKYRVLTGNLSATIASTVTAPAVTDASVFKVGDVVLLPNGTERAWVSAVDLTNNSITITRAFDGSTAASSDTGTITILTEAHVDNTSWVYGPMEGFTTVANNVEIFKDAVMYTLLGKQVDMYGVDDPFEYQVDKKMPELMRALERAVFRKVAASVGSATAPTHMKGLLGFITTNSLQTTQAAMTIGNLESICLSIYNAGGNARDIFCNPKFLQTIKNLYDTSQFLRVTRTEGAVGMSPVHNLETPWGEYKLHTSRWVSTADVFFLDGSKVGLYEYDPFSTYDVAATGPYVAKGILGAYSLCVANETGHGRLNFSA